MRRPAQPVSSRYERAKKNKRPSTTDNTFSPTVKNKFPRQRAGRTPPPREARNSPLYAPKVAVTPGRPTRMHNNRTIDFRLLLVRSRLSARVKSFSSVPNTAEPGEIMIRFRIKSYPILYTSIYHSLLSIFFRLAPDPSGLLPGFTSPHAVRR